MEVPTPPPPPQVPEPKKSAKPILSIGIGGGVTREVQEKIMDLTKEQTKVLQDDYHILIYMRDKGDWDVQCFYPETPKGEPRFRIDGKEIQKILLKNEK